MHYLVGACSFSVYLVVRAAGETSERHFLKRQTQIEVMRRIREMRDEKMREMRDADNSVRRADARKSYRRCR